MVVPLPTVPSVVLHMYVEEPRRSERCIGLERFALEEQRSVSHPSMFISCGASSVHGDGRRCVTVS